MKCLSMAAGMLARGAKRDSKRAMSFGGALPGRDCSGDFGMRVARQAPVFRKTVR
ncbi:MAG: hypothetical protein L0Y75_11200 [Acidobacteria bacterium]|nr:hypothetical protein [Acidobacteriota bacterium]